MHNLDLILTLAGSLGAALFLGYAAQRLGISPIAGYLLAGIVVGPNTPGFVANRELAAQLAEIGVVLLMFGVGLHFQVREFLAVRRIALPGAVIQSVLATGLGMVTARAFGWDWGAGVVYGLAISVASTVVLVRVLADRNALHTATGHIAVGWLVVEDLFTVVVLVLLPLLVGTEKGTAGPVSLAIGLALLKIGVLVAATFLLGGRLIPWLLARVAATRSRELFSLTILTVALGIAVGSARLFGVSMALGAFLAGMVVGRSEFSLRAASDALPMRDAFAVLFFVAMGMLFDPRSVVDAPGLLAATLAIIVLGKPLAALSVVLVLGYPLRVALNVAVALAQIGEFSFILVGLGKELGLFSPTVDNAIVGAAFLSIAINPILFRLVGPVERWGMRHSHLGGWVNGRRRSLPGAPVAGEKVERPSQYRAVLVGYGPVGRTLARLLRGNGIDPTVIEMNLGTVQRLHQEGMAAVYGDASRREVLESAGVERAARLILSASDLHAPEEIIRLARVLNPRIKVLARCGYVGNGPGLRQAGADQVFSEEGEVALAMTESVLRDLGATPDQVDREREQIRAHLTGEPREG